MASNHLPRVTPIIPLNGSLNGGRAFQSVLPADPPPPKPWTPGTQRGWLPEFSATEEGLMDWSSSQVPGRPGPSGPSQSECQPGPGSCGQMSTPRLVPVAAPALPSRKWDRQKQAEAGMDGQIQTTRPRLLAPIWQDTQL